MKFWVLTMLLVWMLGHPTQETCEGSSVWKSKNLKESALQLNGKCKLPILFSFRGKEGFLHSIEVEAGVNWWRPWEQNEISFCTFLFGSHFRENNFFRSAMSEEGHANKMQFPYVHFSICQLAEKIRLFFGARNLKSGRDLNASSLSTIFASNTLQGK